MIWRLITEYLGFYDCLCVSVSMTWTMRRIGQFEAYKKAIVGELYEKLRKPRRNCPPSHETKQSPESTQRHRCISDSGSLLIYPHSSNSSFLPSSSLTTTSSSLFVWVYTRPILFIFTPRGPILVTFALASRRNAVHPPSCPHRWLAPGQHAHHPRWCQIRLCLVQRSSGSSGMLDSMVIEVVGLGCNC